MKGTIKKPAPEIEQEQDEEGSDVESGSSTIASVKGGKMAIIASSAVLITVVIYFLFFKADDKKEEKLQEVDAPKPSAVARSEDGKSPFELPVIKERPKEEVEILAKPSAPELPALPDLPADSVLPDQLNVEAERKAKEKEAKEKEALSDAPRVNNPQDPQAAQNQAPQAAAMDKPKEVNPRYSPIIVFSGADGSPSRGVGYEKNIVKLNEDPIDKLEKTAVRVKTTYVADRTHSITQGKMLTAVMETAINTEIPGSVRAIVSRDVYGESGNEVLIPKGSRLFGSYSSKILRGQGRVDIAWSRLIRPDGVDLAISFNAADQFGRSGIEGAVDNKYSSVITNSLLTSILAVGGVAAAEKMLGGGTNTVTTNPSQGSVTTTAGASTQAVYDVTKTIVSTVNKIVSDNLNATPTIRIPQGTKITVIVNADMNLPSLSKR